MAGIILTAGMSMFPLFASSTDPRSSLTAWDATSSEHTLLLMLSFNLHYFPPIVLTLYFMGL